MGQRGQQVKDPRSICLVHLRSEFSLESLPRLIFLGPLAERHQFLAGSQIRQPDVVKIPLCEFRLGHAPRRSANRAQPQAFVRFPPRPEPHHRNRQFAASFSTWLEDQTRASKYSTASQYVRAAKNDWMVSRQNRATRRRTERGVTVPGSARAPGWRSPMMSASARRQ